MKTAIVITCRFEGFHNWPGAAGAFAYLKNTHRHIFHVTAEKTVSHADRDIEIIEFKRTIEQYCMENFYSGTKSCESMAGEILDFFKLDSCTVLEDGENGGKVYK